MDPKELLSILWRYRKVSLVIFVVTLLAAAVAVKVMKPVYEASAKILIVQPDHTLTHLFEDHPNEDQGTFTRDSDPITTNAQLLEVTPLLEETITRLQLTDRQGHPMRPELLAKGVKVAPLKGTDLIKVSYENTDPALAAQVVNTLVERFAADNIANSRKQATETLKFLDAQIQATRKQLDQNGNQLKHFKTKNQTYDITAELTNATQELDRLRGYARDNAVAVAEGLGRVKLLSSKLDLSPDQALADVAISSHPTIQNLQAQLIAAQTSPLLSSGLGQNYPPVRLLNSQIKRLETQVHDEAALIAGNRCKTCLQGGPLDPMREKLAKELFEEQIDVITGEVRQKALEAQLTGYEHQVSRLPTIEQTLDQLTRSEGFDTDLYTLLLKRQEQARIAKAMSIGDVRIVQPAQVPVRPVRPKLAQSLIAAALMGMFLAGGTALGLDHFDDTLRDESRSRDLLGEVPITGRVPESQASVLLHQPNTPPGLEDAYALVRLDMVRRLGPQFKLLLAGLDAPEVAVLAANLAVSFANSGRRVLLVDGDMRHPSLQQYFVLETDLGFNDMLSGDSSWEDVATKVPGIPLWVIPAKEAVQNPLNLLDSPRLWALNQTITNFDVVLGVAPPITRVPDAVALSTLFSKLWLVLHHRRDTRTSLHEGLHLLAERNLALSGALFIAPAEEGA